MLIVIKMLEYQHHNCIYHLFLCKRENRLIVSLGMQHSNYPTIIDSNNFVFLYENATFMSIQVMWPRWTQRQDFHREMWSCPSLLWQGSTIVQEVLHISYSTGLIYMHAHVLGCCTCALRHHAYLLDKVFLSVL